MKEKNPVGKINNDVSSLNKHIKCDCVSFDVAQCAQMLPMFFSYDCGPSVQVKKTSWTTVVPCSGPYYK